MPLSPRAPRQPIPLPPNTPLPFTSPHLARVEDYRQQAQQNSLAEILRPISGQPSPEPEQSSAATSEPSSPEHIYRGLVSEQYPELLLPPNALPSIRIKVCSSRLRPSRHSLTLAKPSEEDPVFLLGIYARSDGKQLWRVEKTITALPVLHRQLKAYCRGFEGQMPDKSLFGGHAPAKIDARRAALNLYFGMMLDTPMDERAALVVCEFLSSDAIGAQVDGLRPIVDSASGLPASARQRKEGYLTKRGKNFGGWKARFFVLDGPELRYYETAGGPQIGSIKLHNAQIGKQSQQQASQAQAGREEDVENQYRHAFLILEPKRKDSSSLIRHVLCAESDDERDAWVEALLQYVDLTDEVQIDASELTREPSIVRSSQLSRSTQDTGLHRMKSREILSIDKPSQLQGVSYEDTVAAEAPVCGPSKDAIYRRPSPPLSESFQHDASIPHSIGNPSIVNPSTGGTSVGNPAISGPKNGAVIQNVEMWGNKPAATREKKRSIFGFNRGRSSSDLGSGQRSSDHTGNFPSERSMPARVVFAIPLAEAVECSQPVGVDAYLPAVVYRCLEYLKAKNAANEEGIFRLSGSNIVIKALRDRFNTEGDVKLLEGPYYDMHAVASLLKLYLRELPVSILTRELHLDFLKVLGK